MESLGQLKMKRESRDGYQKFTVVREAAAEANARTSAETERSLPRSLTHLSEERAFSSSRICFLLEYRNLKTHAVIVALSLISACSRNLCGRFEKGCTHTRNNGRSLTVYKRVQNTRSAQVMAYNVTLIITGFENVQSKVMSTLAHLNVLKHDDLSMQ
ncbi:hypothetical protein ALC62_01561 [Cyphomyrmex costatus]|uniref:Uncharacterized protein n=1 Tax=Cyphomyrmex costatus TaxID=456900 RepID=A0A195D4K3_9HYME|nr:hypothetical protein ALC62_01561 [Cyphomyrmex costatus]